MGLLPQIDRYLRQTGLAASRLGREALGDPSFVHDLRNGRQPSARTIARVTAYLARIGAGR